MNEEVLITGKINESISPELDLWGFPIALYLFLGGIAAGLIVFSTLFYLKKSEGYSVTICRAVVIAPIALIIGLIALLFDLHNPILSWRLYTSLNLSSPMSWGAWTLLIITPLSIVWSMIMMKKNSVKLKVWFDNSPINKFLTWAEKYTKPMAWILLVFAIILGIYTGILLSAFNARPLWNSGVLGFIFLVSGLSTATAIIMWMSKNKKEKDTIKKIDMFLISLEIFLLIHFIMGLYAGAYVSVRAADLFLFDKFAFSFWVMVVIVGLVLPLLFELLEMINRKIPDYVIALCILIGGLALRIIILEAGQWISYI